MCGKKTSGTLQSND